MGFVSKEMHKCTLETGCHYMVLLLLLLQVVSWCLEQGTARGPL